MPSTKENQDVIHRIDPESSEEISNQFDELVRLLSMARMMRSQTLGGNPSFRLGGCVRAGFGRFAQALAWLGQGRVGSRLALRVGDHLRQEVTDTLSPKEVAEVITEMDSDEAVQVLEDMDEEERDEILSEVPEEEREDIETGLAYPEESAGRRMQTDYVSVGTNWDVGRTIDYLREEEDLPDEFLDLFVVDEQAKPVGVISLSRILRSPRPTLMREICDETQVIVPADMVQEEVAFMFEKYDLTTAGVVDAQGKLIGMITVDGVMEVAREEFEEGVLLLGGVGEETVDDGVLQASAKRFTWLLVNLGTAVLASMVIGMFDATIEQMVALRSSCPSLPRWGNAGTQTLTITVRALATKELTTYNALAHFPQGTGGWLSQRLPVCRLGGGAHDFLV